MRARRAALVSAAVAALAAVLLAGAPARAEPRRRENATVYFDRGAQHYNLGKFEEAIADFERAYQIEPSPILLFNIAQCQRQLANPERALFFYRRYIEQAPAAPNRPEVERRILELDRAVREKQEVARARAQAAAAPAPVLAAPPAGVVAVAPPPPAAGSGARGRWRGPWSLAALAAPSVVWFSGTPAETPVVFAARVEGAYGLLVGPRTVLRLGVDASLAAIPFTIMETDAGKTSSIWGALASARLLHQLPSGLTLGGGLGAGVLWWSGLADGNPFTVTNLPSDGPVPLPTLTVELRAEYALPSGLFLSLAPTLVASKSTSQGLSGATSAVWRFDVGAGLGYTF